MNSTIESQPGKKKASPGRKASAEVSAQTVAVDAGAGVEATMPDNVTEEAAATKKAKAPKKAAAEKKAAAPKKAGTKAAAKTSAAKTSVAKSTAAKAAAKTTAKTAAKTVAPADESVAVEETSKTRKRKASVKKILYAVSEVSPFISTGGMGQVVGSLPVHLTSTVKNIDVRVIAPYYRQIKSKYGAGMTFVGSVNVELAWRNEYCGVFKARRDDVEYYFIDNERYFDRDACYGYFDDGERFAFFSKAVLSVLELIDFTPDIIHSHDWQTAIIPVYLKTIFADKYPKIRTVFTIHNLEYQGKFPLAILGDVFALRARDYGMVEYQGNLNLVKGAIVCADRVTTVSPSYADEIKTTGGYGLEPILRMNEGKLSGIINGIDIDLYNPEKDPSLAQNYNADSLEGKAVNKKELQQLFGLPAEARKPILCMISRLVSHKGLDLLLTIMEELVSDDVQFLLLGTGDHNYELFFHEMAIRYPDNVGVNIAYNPEIGNKIYAGADIMLMPSLSEPCGLSQMIACRYATVPVVRATGGLKDTITDCRGGQGNGFLFENYDAAELLQTIREAVHMYTYKEDDWQNLMRELMRCDFGWDISAKAYAEIYNSL